MVAIPSIVMASVLAFEGGPDVPTPAGDAAWVRVTHALKTIVNARATINLDRTLALPMPQVDSESR